MTAMPHQPNQPDEQFQSLALTERHAIYRLLAWLATRDDTVEPEELDFLHDMADTLGLDREPDDVPDELDDIDSLARVVADIETDWLRALLLSQLIALAWAASTSTVLIGNLLVVVLRLDDGYFFRTGEGATIEEVLVPAARRWGIEMCVRNCKQRMRISSVQNGFAQGDEPNDPNEPGPNAPQGREPTASRRTVPFGMIAYGFVVLWYLKHGNPETDLKRAKLLAPWSELHNITDATAAVLDADNLFLRTRQTRCVHSSR